MFVSLTLSKCFDCFVIKIRCISILTPYRQKSNNSSIEGHPNHIIYKCPSILYKLLLGCARSTPSFQMILKQNVSIINLPCQFLPITKHLASRTALFYYCRALTKCSPFTYAPKTRSRHGPYRRNYRGSIATLRLSSLRRTPFLLPQAVRMIKGKFTSPSAGFFFLPVVFPSDMYVILSLPYKSVLPSQC
jgi:hypothetical protein